MQAFLIKTSDATEQIGELLLAALCGRIATFMRHLESQAPGHFLHRFGKRQLFVLHQKAQRRAMRAAAEAVIELLVRAHPEGGGFLVVERTAGFVFAPGFLERYPAADDFNNIGARDQLIDKGLWNAAGHGPQADRRALIRTPTAPMSARPAALALMAAMTLPISLIDAAQVAAMASLIRASSSVADNCAGI